MYMNNWSISEVEHTKYLFFTGKGGVGKTSIAAATALALTKVGNHVLLVSTDPASNLQDVFGTPLGCKPKQVNERLYVSNLDPLQAAADYRERVVAPYRGQLPDDVLMQMAEQLSGSCTVEIAAFNLFADFITSPDDASAYDNIIFDTAPTGHTLRMLQLPSAWSDFIKTSTHGASCLGQLAGLEERKSVYSDAVHRLTDGTLTRLVLVSRPEQAALTEAARSAKELLQLGISNQCLIVNGILPDEGFSDDTIAQTMHVRQKQAMVEMPSALKTIPLFCVNLKSFNIDGTASLSRMFDNEGNIVPSVPVSVPDERDFDRLVDDIHSSGVRVVFTMGKGGVGKTTIATRIATELHRRGVRVCLTTTDPANHIDYNRAATLGIHTERIDTDAVLEQYKQEVRTKASAVAGSNDMDYIEEDLRSPCTQEIALFRAFAKIVDRADNEVVVIDTAPTGHTLLLLDSTESYHRELRRSEGDVPDEVRHLLPRLRDPKQTAVIIATLPEATPVYEAERLQADLQRSHINIRWWVVNACLSLSGSRHPLIAARANAESKWIRKVESLSNGNYVLIPWK